MTKVRSIDDLFETGSPSVGPPHPSTPRQPRFTLWLFSLTIFSSAFLLFQVQPLIAKLVLPWFGGTAGVWSACLLFFQVLLFCGYAYAHVTTSRLSPWTQSLLHVLLVAAACAALPILPSESWKPVGDEEPIWRIVGLLGVTVGLPFFILSATAPLLQSWFSRAQPGRSVYRLYALSNAGSLLALVSFPALFDRIFATRLLATMWSWGFATFTVLCGACAVLSAIRSSRLSSTDSTALGAVTPPVVPEVAPAVDSLSSVPARAPTFAAHVLWFALAMVPSILLLATTNQVCQDIASVPFLWVVPLTLYLLSFILCFDSDRWYSRRLLMPAAAFGLAATYVLLCAVDYLPRPLQPAANTMELQISAYFTTFFLCAMVCHGELARQRPPVAQLTSFYLILSAGGAAGGVFVAFLAPRIFHNFYELHLGLFACAALMLVVLYTDRHSRLYQGQPRGAWLTLLVLIGLFGLGLFHDTRAQRTDVIAAGRNFYGVLRVMQTHAHFENVDEGLDELRNGRIVHGREFTDPQHRKLPTAYYGPDAGVGRLLMATAGAKPRRVGIIGLGVGTLAAYARPGDAFRFYEINPMDERMARQYFHYLDDCAGHVDVVLGDARLNLDREQPQNFDVLVLDAFSGDAIPIHLLTVEAFAIYLQHLAADGVIAVHISNQHFGLGPVVDAVSHAHQLEYAAVLSQATSFGAIPSLWVLVARNRKILDADFIRGGAGKTNGTRVLWTDDHASLLDVWLSE
jgi:predicted O-methyltransferase YrrM